MTGGTGPRKLRSAGGALPVGSGAASPVEGQCHGRLARLFARDPELILAALEGLAAGETEPGRLVLAAARQALRERPEYADLHYYAARAAAHLGEHAEAERLVRAALRLNPRYNDALILAARLAAVAAKARQAIDYLRQALANGANYPDVHILMGELWRQERQPEQARRAYRRALELNGNLAAAREGLAALGGVEAGGGGQ